MADTERLLDSFASTLTGKRFARRTPEAFEQLCAKVLAVTKPTTSFHPLRDALVLYPNASPFDGMAGY